MCIAAELAEIAACRGFFAITVAGDPQGWRPVESCYADGYADLIDATAKRHDTVDLRIAASLVQFSHATRLWSPVLACVLTHGVVPDLTGLQRAADTAALRLPEPVGVPVESDVAGQLYRTVVQEHLDVFAAGLRVKVAPGLLDGNVASALVAATRALYWARPQLRDPATRLARSLLTTAKLSGTGTIRYNLAFRRRSCCLYYRVPGGSKCADCGLISSTAVS
ncbi:(2Fe-2S)-binding protein [Mycobacterium deserti]|uniref:(2Fe-2S)-binding protein n=1 Tax=Mycobacterium deserti TaxID=2978347 RepID=A0ABT2M6N9_9MYCO|nr:(2Fe-2S)-binding protein [Mycobacterium deserti]MCT7657917.1 (2Fe-2S)-binding protein [Mycobacterium deserti]